jgi:hypothetical protein
MTHQNPPISETPRRREYEYAAARDARLQADPELLADERRVGPFMIGLYVVGMIFAVCLVLYGLAHQREETAETSATPPSASTQQPSSQQGAQGGMNAPAQQQPQQNPPAQPQQNQQPPPQQNQPQNAPVPKQ